VFADYYDFDAPTILFDNEAAAYDITAYVRGLGHDRITFVEGPAGLHTSAQRRAGYTRAGGTDSIPGGFAYEDGIAAAEVLLAREALPQAVVAANDEAAIGLLVRLRDAGVDVPGDISITGIDDTRPAHFVGLTTVTVPLHEMGRRAAHADQPIGLEAVDALVGAPGRVDREFDGAAGAVFFLGLQRGAHAATQCRGEQQRQPADFRLVHFKPSHSSTNAPGAMPDAPAANARRRAQRRWLPHCSSRRIVRGPYG
jgi:hypothetical protein